MYIHLLIQNYQVKEEKKVREENIQQYSLLFSCLSSVGNPEVLQAFIHDFYMHKCAYIIKSIDEVELKQFYNLKRHLVKM